MRKRSRLPFKIEETFRISAFSLIQEYKDQQADIFLYGLIAIIYLQMPFSIYALSSFLGSDKATNNIVASSLVFFIAVIYIGFKSVKAFRQMLNTRLGIEAEWVVADSLAKIQEKGLRVFHDVQGPNFNIDHVITFSGGVVAIETKGRRKPNIKSKDNTHKLTVEGDKIVFPHHTDTKIIEQAKRQANWLTKELSSATGGNVQVNPMVVIPGWFIERKQRPTVPVLNHKNVINNYSVSTSQIFKESDLTRINHQLDRLSLRGNDEF